MQDGPLLALLCMFLAGPLEVAPGGLQIQLDPPGHPQSRFLVSIFHFQNQTLGTAGSGQRWDLWEAPAPQFGEKDQQESRISMGHPQDRTPGGVRGSSPMPGSLQAACGVPLGVSHPPTHPRGATSCECPLHMSLHMYTELLGLSPALSPMHIPATCSQP